MRMEGRENMEANEKSILNVKELCLWYGNHQALKNINIDIPIKNVLANFFMFMPITILIKIKISRLSLKKILLYIICFNLVIEILQFLTLQGSFDVDDILLRLFGAWISYAVYSSFRRKTFKSFLRK